MTEPRVRVPLRPVDRCLEHDGATLRLVGECLFTSALVALSAQGFDAALGVAAV